MINIDKSLGSGYWNVENPTLMDDIAFSLLCDSIKRKSGKYINQAFFRNYKDYSPYNRYYNEAKLIIRSNKIKNLNERIQKKDNRNIERKRSLSK